MPSVMFGDLEKLKPNEKHHTPARQSALDVEVTNPLLMPQAADAGHSYAERVTVATSTFARLVMARKALAGAMGALYELDEEAIAAAPDDTTGIATVRRILEDRREACRQAWIRAIELANCIGGVWEHLSPEERRRSGLATLIGADPTENRLLWELWTGEAPIDALAPLPEPWGIPSDLAHRVGVSPGVGSYVVDLSEPEAEFPPF